MTSHFQLLTSRDLEKTIATDEFVPVPESCRRSWDDNVFVTHGLSDFIDQLAVHEPRHTRLCRLTGREMVIKRILDDSEHTAIDLTAEPFSSQTCQWRLLKRYFATDAQKRPLILLSLAEELLF